MSGAGTKSLHCKRTEKNFIKNFYASIEILLSLRNEKRDGFQMYSLFLLCYDHCHRIFVASLTNLFVFIFSGFRRTDQQRAAKRPCQRKVQKICGKIRSQEVTHGESSALPSRFSFSWLLPSFLPGHTSPNVAKPPTDSSWCLNSDTSMGHHQFSFDLWSFMMHYYKTNQFIVSFLDKNMI